MKGRKGGKTEGRYDYPTVRPPPWGAEPRARWSVCRSYRPSGFPSFRPLSLRRGLQRHLQALPWIERIAQPADQLADALPVGPEVPQGPADGPGCPLEGHRDLARGRGPADGSEPFDRRLAGPPDHARPRAGREQVFVEV